jgi:hypothetical protein
MSGINVGEDIMFTRAFAIGLALTGATAAHAVEDGTRMTITGEFIDT